MTHRLPGRALIYGYDAPHAFELLHWQSQHANITLHRLAEQITADFTALIDDETLPTRTMYDQLLLNIHTRTTPNPEEALHDAH